MRGGRVFLAPNNTSLCGLSESIHLDTAARISGEPLRALAALHLRLCPEWTQRRVARELQRRLAALGLNYHPRTLKRQLTGQVRSVPSQVELSMRGVLAERCGLQTPDDVDAALRRARLPALPHLSEAFVEAGALASLAQLWLHRHPRQSKRGLALCLADRLRTAASPYTADSLQALLAGKRNRLTRRVVREELVRLLRADGVSAEELRRAVREGPSAEALAFARARELVPAAGLVQLGRLWRLRRREPSSRRLARRLRTELASRGLELTLHQIHVGLGGKSRRVRRQAVNVLREFVRRELPAGADLARVMRTQQARFTELSWVPAQSVSTLAREWLRRHPRASMRQLALRLSERVREFGYATSPSTIQPILGGWKKRARGFIYRAMQIESQRGALEHGRCRTRACPFPAVRGGLCRTCWLAEYEPRAFERRQGVALAHHRTAPSGTRRA